MSAVAAEDLSFVETFSPTEISQLCVEWMFGIAPDSGGAYYKDRMKFRDFLREVRKPEGRRRLQISTPVDDRRSDQCGTLLP